MFHKRTVLFLILLFVIFSFGINDLFANNENNNQAQKNKLILTKNNIKYNVVSLSQISNDLKKDLLSDDKLWVDLLDNQLQLIIKQAENNKNFIPLNDLLFAIETSELEKASRNKSLIGLDKTIKPIYISEDQQVKDPEQKISIKNNFVVISLDNNAEEKLFNFDKHQIGDKYIDLIPIKSDKIKLNFIKVVDENKSININLE